MIETVMLANFVTDFIKTGISLGAENLQAYIKTQIKEKNTNDIDYSKLVESLNKNDLYEKIKSGEVNESNISDYITEDDFIQNNHIKKDGFSQEGVLNFTDSFTEHRPLIKLPVRMLTPELGRIFVGREQELVGLTREMMNAHQSLLVTGSGGSGKTALINQWIFSVANHDEKYKNIIFLRCGYGMNVALSDPKILEELEIPVDIQDKISIFKSWLKNHENTLVIFDDIEKQKEIEDLVFFAKNINNVSILATSRYENILGFDKVFSISDLATSSSISLFKNVANKPDITDEDAQKIIEITGKHPLVIEIIAEFIKSKNVSSKEVLDFLIKKDFHYSKLDLINFNDKATLKRAILGDIYSAKVRTLIVGSGGSGKTTLFQLLSGQKVQKYNKASSIINNDTITDCSNFWQVKPSFDNELDMVLWDFAGQSQYYGLHQTFFHSRCVFVLVLDSRHEQSPYEWLHQISHLSHGFKVRVIILVNVYEDCPNSINIVDIRNQFTNIVIEEESVCEINLQQYSDKKLTDIMNEVSTHPKKHKQLKIFLETLTKAGYESQTVMEKESFHLFSDISNIINQGNLILSKADFEKLEHYDIYKDSFKKDKNYKSFSNWIEGLGSLVKGSDNNWISASWFSTASYHLLNVLQNAETESSFKFFKSDIHQYLDNHIIKLKQRLDNEKNFSKKVEIRQTIIDIEKIANEKYNHDSYLDLLLCKMVLSDLVIKTEKENSYIFPSILPCNYPKMLDEIKKSSILYGYFCINIDFMPLGLFSKWLADLIRVFELEEINYSRHCCILEEEHSYLTILWKPYYKQLEFSFYYQSVEDFSQNKESFVTLANNAIHIIEKHTSFNQDEVDDLITVVTTSDSMLGKKWSLDDIMTEIVNDLQTINEQGFVRHFYSGKHQGNTIMNNPTIIKDSKVNTGIQVNGNDSQIVGNVGSGTQNVTQNISTVDNDIKNNYMTALDSLLNEYESQDLACTTGYSKQDFKKIVDFAKNDIQNDNLDDKKIGVFEQIISGFEKAQPILKTVIGLISIYGMAAGLV